MLRPTSSTYTGDRVIFIGITRDFFPETAEEKWEEKNGIEMLNDRWIIGQLELYDKTHLEIRDMMNKQ